MPILEMRLEAAIAAGAPRPRWVRSLTYWRSRAPKNGAMNSRQRWKIQRLWEELKPRLESPPADDWAYLASMAGHASGYRVRDFFQMRAWQANLLVEALKDRLHYATRRG